MERKDTGPKVIQPAENMNTQCNERPPQSTASKAMDKRDTTSKCKSKKMSPQ